jgi:hypothetical protein
VIERQDNALSGWSRPEAGWQYETESRDGGETRFGIGCGSAIGRAILDLL